MLRTQQCAVEIDRKHGLCVYVRNMSKRRHNMHMNDIWYTHPTNKQTNDSTLLAPHISCRTIISEMCECARASFIVTKTHGYVPREKGERDEASWASWKVHWIRGSWLTHFHCGGYVFFVGVWYSIEQYQSVLKESCPYESNVYRSIVQLYDTRNEHERNDCMFRYRSRLTERTWGVIVRV